MDKPQEFVVYQSWPLETIKEARMEFWEAMHDGANQEEIAAGLRCMDFLCRASDIPEDFQPFIDAALNEADMRIELLNAYDLAQLEEAEKLEKAKKAIKHMHQTIIGIQQQMAGRWRHQAEAAVIKRFNIQPRPEDPWEEEDEDD